MIGFIKRCLDPIPPGTLEWLTREEGFRRAEYLCSESVPTIGIGWAFRRNPASKAARRKMEKLGCRFMGDTPILMTRAGAQWRLRQQVKRDAKWLSSFLCWRYLNGARRAALLNMVYQLGRTGFMEFVKTRQRLLERDWPEAAAEALRSDWARQTPARAKRVAAVLESGVLPVV